jgi:acetyl esterase/lipase
MKMSCFESSNRARHLAMLIIGILPIVFVATRALGAEADWTKETVVYKTVGPTKIEADVYRRNGTETRPVIVWIHGGALIVGNRHGVPKNIEQLARERNYVLISLDYRLAPEVKLPAIIEDVQDAFRWIRKVGPEQFHLDPDKIVVCGGSAGGYLTMMTGICVEPKPKALVAYYGYGDVDGPWYTQPSEHYRKQPLVTKEEAEQVVGGAVTTGEDSRPRGKYYLYLRQNGWWCREVSGFDPATQRDKLDRYCPVRNITASYPPIVMLHGTADTDVPYQESADMAAALKKAGVRHELLTVEGGGHGLGRDGGDPKVIADAHARALAFIREQLE